MQTVMSREFTLQTSCKKGGNYFSVEELEDSKPLIQKPKLDTILG